MIKRRLLKNLLSNEKGTATLEFVVVLPIMLFLFFSIAYYGIAFDRTQKINQAAREAARVMAITGDENKAKAKFAEVLLQNNVPIETMMVAKANPPEQINDGELVGYLTKKEDKFYLGETLLTPSDSSVQASIINYYQQQKQVRVNGILNSDPIINVTGVELGPDYEYYIPKGLYVFDNGNTILEFLDQNNKHTNTFTVGSTVKVRIKSNTINNPSIKRVIIYNKIGSQLKTLPLTQISTKPPYTYETIFTWSTPGLFYFETELIQANVGTFLFDEAVEFTPTTEHFRIYADSNFTKEKIEFEPGQTLYGEVSANIGPIGSKSVFLATIINNNYTTLTPTNVVYNGNYIRFQVTWPSGLKAGEWYSLCICIKNTSGTILVNQYKLIRNAPSEYQQIQGKVSEATIERNIINPSNIYPKAPYLQKGKITSGTLGQGTLQTTNATYTIKDEKTDFTKYIGKEVMVWGANLDASTIKIIYLTEVKNNPIITEGKIDNNFMINGYKLTSSYDIIEYLKYKGYQEFTIEGTIQEIPYKPFYFVGDKLVYGDLSQYNTQYVELLVSPAKSYGGYNFYELSAIKKTTSQTYSGSSYSGYIVYNQQGQLCLDNTPLQINDPNMEKQLKTLAGTNKLVKIWGTEGIGNQSLLITSIKPYEFYTITEETMTPFDPTKDITITEEGPYYKIEAKYRIPSMLPLLPMLIDSKASPWQGYITVYGKAYFKKEEGEGFM